MIDATAATAFFEDAFGDLPEGQQILIWSLPDKVSRFHREPSTAVRDALERALDREVYVGVGFRGRDHGPKERGGTDDVTGIIGLWADLDIRDPVHKKENLPPDHWHAAALIGELPLSPTYIVHSGHGLQAWWLFMEPYLFDDAADRERTEQISAGWTDLLRRRAKAHDWEVDSVWDLSRVMRVPGTINHKRLPVPVRTLEDEGRRYAGPSDFLDYVELRPKPKVSVNGTHAHATATAGDLVLDPAAEPPFSKWLALRENDPKFRQTWDRKRRDLQDQSSSGYHMALASQTAAVGWSDQEIVNLCIAWQRQHVEDLAKVLRPDYWLGSPTRAGTLQKARQMVNQERAAAMLAGDSEEAVDESDRTALLATVSEFLGIEVRDWVQHGRQRARYSLQLASGREVAIGGGSVVLSPDRFRVRLYDEAQVTLPSFKKERWLRIAATLGKAARLVENQEATREFATREWIAGYLASTGVARGDGERLGEAIAAGRPFVHEAVVYLHAPALRKYVLLNVLEQIEAADLHDALRALGFAQAKKSGRDHTGKVRNRSYWWAPESVLSDTSAPPDTRTAAMAAATGAIKGERVEVTR